MTVFFACVGLFLFGYLTTTIPSASAISTAQTTILTYGDGRSELGRIGSLNRIAVPLAQVPVPVRRAVLAAEDRNFYDEPGVSVQGIARALVANVRGGEISQGGSTITQQYAKNAFLTHQRTISRKVREIFIAIKLDRSESKNQILEDYLNTIYFGRGAYGIQTAAQAYFGKPVSQLDVAEGAVLAAVVRAPSLYDPLTHPAAAKSRWRYIVDGMVGQGWLAPTDAAALRYPKVSKPSNRDALGGPTGHLIQAVKRELAAKGFDEERLSTGGYRVVTTVDERLQKAAVRAQDEVLGARKRPVSGMAAVEPGTGRILAMYGGRDFTGSQPAAQVNLATNRRPAGSSFKPYTLATALEQGISLRTEFRGTSPLFVDGWNSKDHLVHNDSGEQCPRCDLVAATAHSVNTVFAQLVIEVGPDKVAETAHAAGITADLTDAGGEVPASVTLGTKSVSPLEQADGFATFAAGGVHVAPYLVAKVVDSDGHVAYAPKPKRQRAFGEDVAADATYAMTKVVEYGTGTRAQLPDGRPVAGKTGTTTNNTDAWFVGFTPQLSTAVWLGNVNNKPLRNVPGYSSGVYGGQLPAEIWRVFMNDAMKGQPQKDFPPPAYVGNTGSGLPPPPPSPTPSASISPSPTASPSGSPSPTPSASASPSASPSRRPTGPPSTAAAASSAARRP